MNSILLIDPEQVLYKDLFSQIDLVNFTLTQSNSQSDALKTLSKNSFDVVVINLTTAKKADELDLISYIKVNFERSDIIVITDIKEIESARTAIRKGAYLYLLKPVAPGDVKIVLNKIRLHQDQNQQFKDSQNRLMQELIGNSKNMGRIIKIAKKVAPTTSNVLITGETGTGKEVFARYIHMMSKRSDNEFIAVNCGAIPENLVESEFFGHKKGSFTGAVTNKRGLFEEAHLGTVLLDEVGDLPLPAQAKLLRFLQDYEIRPVGATQNIKVDVRVMAATNKNLQEEVVKGNFREDLFYRLNIIHIEIPPLRDRTENIGPLANFFLFKYAHEMEKKMPEISEEAKAILGHYTYPGNIRELENIIERAVVLAEGETIRGTDLPEKMKISRGLLPSGQAIKPSENISLDKLEKIHILKVMEKTNHNQTEASKILGISRSTLWRKLKTHNLVTEEEEEISRPG